MDAQEREPDFTDDPRDRDVSDQLPEEQEEGAAEGNEPPKTNGRTPQTPEPEEP